jgi:hypothetical protein
MYQDERYEKAGANPSARTAREKVAGSIQDVWALSVVRLAYVLQNRQQSLSDDLLSLQDLESSEFTVNFDLLLNVRLLRAS